MQYHANATNTELLKFSIYMMDISIVEGSAMDTKIGE